MLQGGTDSQSMLQGGTDSQSMLQGGTDSQSMLQGGTDSQSMLQFQSEMVLAVSGGSAKRPCGKHVIRVCHILKADGFRRFPIAIIRLVPDRLAP